MTSKSERLSVLSDIELFSASCGVSSGYSKTIVGGPARYRTDPNHAALNQKATTDVGPAPAAKGLPVTGVSAPVVAFML